MKWFEFFQYSDGKLFWKVRPCKRVQIGDEAGCNNGKGYLVVMFRGKFHKVHRIIYEMVKGPIPKKMQIDHINGIRTDNRVDNLRLVTQNQNQWNSCSPKNNTSGFKGVCWRKSHEKWNAYIGVFGKRKCLGLFSTAEQAYAARLAAENELHGEFAATETRKLVAKIA